MWGFERAGRDHTCGTVKNFVHPGPAVAIKLTPGFQTTNQRPRMTDGYDDGKVAAPLVLARLHVVCGRTLDLIDLIDLICYVEL